MTIERSWDDSDDHAFLLRRIDAKSSDVPVPILLPDGSMTVVYLNNSNSAVSDVISAVRGEFEEDASTPLAIFELHLVNGTLYFCKRSFVSIYL